MNDYASAADLDAKPVRGGETALARIMPSGAFIAEFIPPDYLIDGIVQRRFVYSFTAKTGVGKTALALFIAARVAPGRPIGSIEVEQGRVLYLAGENPDDVRMRWQAMSEAMGFDPQAIEVDFLPGTLDIPKVISEASARGPYALVIVDTSAAYFRGEDENSNSELGNYARSLRQFTTLPGGPAVIVLCHPTKNAGDDNLIPRGGGAFLVQVDGNLCCKASDEIVELSWQGKLRGPGFEPVSFELVKATSSRLVDSKAARYPQ